MHKLIHLPKIVSVLVATLFAGCSGGSGGNGGTPGTGGDFVLLQTTPRNHGRSFLNEFLALDFSNEIDVASASFNALSFAVFDLNGKQLSEPVEGTFAVATANGDEPVLDPVTGAVIAGRRLIFKPNFPRLDSFDDGGFRPARQYIVQLIKGDPRRNVGLIDIDGSGLAAAFSFTFSTADGTTPQQLFRDTMPGGPGKVGFIPSPVNPGTQEVELNELGQVATEIRLKFNQPLNPHSANLPLRIDLDPRTRSVNTRGRIYLEYEDPSSGNTWIPAAVELESNTLEGSTVVLRPFGILPNNARIRVIVEATLEDMSGESNINNSTYVRVFGEFETKSTYDVGFDALVENFVSAANVDLSAGFVEPLAEMVPGAIRANFDFEGTHTNLRYEPNTSEVVLDTDFTQIQPSNGRAINVSNGIFMFRDVKIPAGVTVRGVGSRPMVWLVTGDFEVEGLLMVTGGGGQRVDTLSSANYPSGGGIGNCGGGNGGEGSQLTKSRTLVAQSGWGPGQVPGGGGGGGRISCTITCHSGAGGGGSGGGGGSFVTQGDPYYKLDATSQWVQVKGVGGFGCTNRTSRLVIGGEAGPLAFTDSRPDNDFWGAAVNVHLGIRSWGEMADPHGGQGGGGGGDLGASCTVPDRINFAGDDKGGGGGAGGGVLIIKALGSIIIKRTGKIVANGGHGGGGAFAGTCNRAGGGGGGSGGMVVLMAGRRIQIYKHQGTYAAPANNYNFAISADGGVGLARSNVWTIRGKYNPAPHTGTAAKMNARPSGGFGGLGIVQFMAPPGPNPGEDDGTNTVLDDSIDIIDTDTKSLLQGAAKMGYLAWRGMIDSNGVPRDDSGVEVKIGKNEGDVRPSPMLLPAPYGTRSRIRSRWIDLGAADRRMTVAGGDGLPRGVGQTGKFTAGASFGPRPEFSALVPGGMTTNPLAGYIRTRDGSVSGVEIDYPSLSGLAELSVLSIESFSAGKDSGAGRAAATYYRGHRRYIKVTLAASNPALASLPQRYTHYFTTVVRNQTPVAGEFRVLGHDDRTIFLSQESGRLDDKLSGSSEDVRITITSKLFSVFTNGVEGFPESFIGRAPKLGRSGRVPRANIRIGFAFHQDPKDPSAKRFPPLNAGKPTFFADWHNLAEIERLHRGGYRFVMYDILFNTRYQENPSYPNSNSLGPDTPRPELRRLVLPYRF